MHLVPIPPGARANAYLPDEHETAIYVLSGEVEMWYGEGLEQHLVVRAGEFLYIPANMPHQPFNPGAIEAVAVLVRTDPNEQESVVLLPHLDAVPSLADREDARSSSTFGGLFYHAVFHHRVVSQVMWAYCSLWMDD